MLNAKLYHLFHFPFYFNMDSFRVLFIHISFDFRIFFSWVSFSAVCRRPLKLINGKVQRFVKVACILPSMFITCTDHLLLTLNIMWLDICCCSVCSIQFALSIGFFLLWLFSTSVLHFGSGTTLYYYVDLGFWRIRQKSGTRWSSATEN